MRTQTFCSVIIMKKIRAYSKNACEAVSLLGQQIKLGRKKRKWSEGNLAERAGVSRATLRKIESGEMACSIGLYFELATLVGVNLFDHEYLPLSRQVEQVEDKLAVLPQRIKSRRKVVDDDF